MPSERIVGIIIMAVCCFSCAAIFFGIGISARRSKKPVNFWAGTKIDADRVSDLRSYNCACAVMWKIYSVPYWICGVLACLDFVNDRFMISAIILLFMACFPGILILIWKYKKIEKAYISV